MIFLAVVYLNFLMSCTYSIHPASPIANAALQMWTMAEKVIGTETEID